MTTAMLPVTFALMLCTIAPTWGADTDLSREEPQAPTPTSKEDIDDKRGMGGSMNNFVRMSFVTLDDDSHARKLATIVRRLEENSATKSPFPFKCTILNEPVPIAASFPGYLYLSSGLLDLLTSEDELAAIIAVALVRTTTNIQYDRYVKERDQRDMAAWLYLATFAIGAGLTVASVGMTAAANTLGAVQSAQRVGMVGNAFTGGLTVAVDSFSFPDPPSRVPKRYTNRMGPSAARVPFAGVYATEVFEGYDDTTELNAIRLAVERLKRAGYDPMALHASFGRLLAARNEYVSSGHYSSLLMARPGLEERILHAKTAAEALK